MPTDSHNRDAEPGPDPRCGSTAGYQAHYDNGTTTCQACRTAQAAWQDDYRRKVYLIGGPLKVDATGTRRRIHALMRLGWPADRLGAHLAVSGAAVREWTYTSKVRRSTAARVAELYDRLCWTPGPSTKTRARAVAAGWPPPLAWDDDTIDDPKARPSTGAYADRKRAPVDEVAVQRALHGDPVHLRPAERAEAVRRLTAAGHSAADIAERLRTTTRTVVRHRTTPTREAS